MGGQIPEVELLLPMLGAERERHRISGIQYNVRNVLHYIPISGWYGTVKRPKFGNGS